MQCIAVVLATIVIVPVSGDSSCSKTGNCKELACGPLEVPVSGKPRYDHFCRPLFTPPWELRKLRRCVCKRRYLRNSWGECIPRLKCIPCQFRWQKDYRECVDGCPATCNFPFRKSCDKPCAPGCGCPPGWVVHPRKPWKCIKTNGCLPKCPAHSEFQSCVSSCLPKCGRVTPEKCEVNCNRGACVCKKGYIGLEEEGKLTCVREVVCSWITRSKPSLKPSDIPHSGTPGGTLTPTSTLSKIVGQALNATMTAATISSSGSQANPVETPSISDASPSCWRCERRHSGWKRCEWSFRYNNRCQCKYSRRRHSKWRIRRNRSKQRWYSRWRHCKWGVSYAWRKHRKNSKLGHNTWRIRYEWRKQCRC
nr:uncharacterized protein LOC119164247 [Rhipicephalus microplus]